MQQNPNAEMQPLGSPSKDRELDYVTLDSHFPGFILESAPCRSRDNTSEDLSHVA